MFAYDTVTSPPPVNFVREVRIAGGWSTGFVGGVSGYPPPVEVTNCVDPDALRQHLEITKRSS